MGASIRSISATCDVDVSDSSNIYPIVAITFSETHELLHLVVDKRVGTYFELYRRLCAKRGLLYKRNLGIITWIKGAVIFQRNFPLPYDFRDKIHD